MSRMTTRAHVTLKRVARMFNRRYWATLGALTMANIVALGATGAMAGLSVDAFTSGAREVVIINVLALTLLVWPTLALTVRGLAARRRWCFWGALLHTVGVFAVMEVYFGKPFGLASGSAIANVVPTLLFLSLAAWLIVEWRETRVAEGTIARWCS
ncbi:MAG: hypothetical protein AAFZ01_04335 [Pseudomonadota bacterium]